MSGPVITTVGISGGSFCGKKRKIGEKKTELVSLLGSFVSVNGCSLSVTHTEISLGKGNLYSH